MLNATVLRTPGNGTTIENAYNDIYGIHARQWHDLTMKNDRSAVWEAMLGLVEQVNVALDTVQVRSSKTFPDRIWTSIADGTRNQATLFQWLALMNDR